MAGSIPWQDYRRLAQGLREHILRMPASAAELTVCVPWTAEPLGSVPCYAPEAVASAVARARACQPAWAALPFAERRRVLLRFHDLVLARQQLLLDLMQLETGKARKHAVEEVLDTAIVARHYAYHAERLLRPQRRRGALPFFTQVWEHRHPLGVIGIIAPWNYPLSLAVTDAIPALLAGNAVVLKPDSRTPFTALLVAAFLYDAGLPRDLFQLVTGEGRVTGTALIDCVDFVTFTGSSATGRVVARQAAGRLIGSALELGGKNAMIVLDDANLEAAVTGALGGCFASAGQLCVAIERLYVHERLYDAFVSRFVSRTRALKLGAGFDFACDMGSLIGSEQLATVQSHVADALDHGATLLVGGQARPDLGPYFYEPTILANVTPAMRLFDEETFGPVVALYKVDSAEQALTLANNSRYGLNASIWTRDRARGRAVATRLQAGTANVNDVYAAAWASVDAPMGGFKDSGLGRRHGAAGVLKYTEPQTVAVQRVLPLAGPHWLPDGLRMQILTGWLRAIRNIPGLR